VESRSVPVVDVAAEDGGAADHKIDTVVKHAEAETIDAPPAPQAPNVDHGEQPVDQQLEPAEKHNSQSAGTETSGQPAVADVDTTPGDTAKAE
jgi:hypothetical protein